MPALKTTAAISIAAASLAEAATGPPWTNRDDIPSGCALTVKVPDGGRCLFPDQCASGDCCPFYRSCMTQGVLEYQYVEQDPLRLAMMWGTGGDVANVNGVQNNELEGATDTCDRAKQAEAELGRCSALGMNGADPEPVLEDGSFTKAFDISSAECVCDQRFLDLYLAGDWTGALHDGTFRNYCDISDWEYTLSATEASSCPSGSAIITDVEECKLAIAYLGLTDATSYMNGEFGADAFPGCVNNAGNNNVAFNSQSSAAGFQLSSVEQYVCKVGVVSDNKVDDGATTDAATTDTATTEAPAPTVVQVSGEASLSVPSRADFCGSAEALGAVGKAFATILTGAGVTEEDVTVDCKDARRLSSARRLADSVDVEYVIEMESDDASAPLDENSVSVTTATTLLTAMTPEAMTVAVATAFTAANVDMTVTVEELSAPTAEVVEAPGVRAPVSFAPSSSASGLVAALAAAVGAAVVA